MILKFNVGCPAFRLQLPDVLVDTQFVNVAQGAGRNFQGDPFARFRNVKTFGEQIGQKTAPGLSIGVRNPVAGDRALSSQFTYSGHGVF